MLEENNSEKKSNLNSLIKESIKLLEWGSLQEHISSFAATPMGKKSIIDFQIPTKLEESQNLLNETIEINNLENELDHEISFEGVFDIKKNIEVCFKGGVVNSESLLQIAETIGSARRIKKILFNLNLRPSLSMQLDQLIEHNKLEKDLKNGIEKNGRISDKSSNELASLRRKLISKKHERRKILDNFIQKNKNFIQDSIIGDRYGRPVLAIKVNFSERFKGIIHDSSSSGNTIFLEPETVVQKGNEIASINAKILNEEFKLLKIWSNIIAENRNSLIKVIDILLKIENAVIRSRYSNWIKGKAPKFESHINVLIEGFTHPLLIWEHKTRGSGKPIPINFYITRSTKVVAITGPNTGGKTAALKGLGIALLMARAGLFIPSISAPVIPFCPNIFIDIGDEQTLNGNLSTFSGHILKINKILDSLNNKQGLSIVLLDEIGSGTDPAEGTALAIALLQEFAEKSDLTMATTHYGEIKALKYSDSRFENVSVSFDDETLIPTYSLNWGIPGRSNALSISKRIGLKQKIIDNAAKYLKPKEIENINQIIKGLEEQRIKQQNAAEQAAELIARTEILYEELKNNYEYQKLNAEKFQAKEREKLTKAIYKAKAEVVKLISKLRNKDATGEDSRTIGIRLKEIESKFTKTKKETLKASWKPKIGEFINIKTLNTKGIIIDSDDKGNIFKVKCGSFNSIVSLKDIEGINGEKPSLPKQKIEVKSQNLNLSFSKIRTSKNTIDLRGLRVDEAEILVEQKIKNFHGPLWMIHGVGTGKLRNGLRLWLSKLEYVEKIEDAPPSEGGAGCSIVWIK